jgi:DNA-binding MarR family transcriptional regulator
VSETHDQLARQVQATYRALIRAMKGATIVDWVELDLTLAQIKVLFALADEETTTIGRLAEQLEVGQSTASHLVERLVQAGLAARGEDPDDRRRAVPRLTPRGEDLVDRLLGGAGALPAALPLLNDAELAAIRRSLELLIAAVNKSVQV